MLKVALFAVPAGVILGGIGAWAVAASTPQARLETASKVSIDPFQLMLNSKDLRDENFTDERNCSEMSVWASKNSRHHTTVRFACAGGDFAEPRVCREMSLWATKNSRNHSTVVACGRS
jgi:hypothetical protein